MRLKKGGKDEEGESKDERERAKPSQEKGRELGGNPPEKELPSKPRPCFPGNRVNRPPSPFPVRTPLGVKW